MLITLNCTNYTAFKLFHDIKLLEDIAVLFETSNVSKRFVWFRFSSTLFLGKCLIYMTRIPKYEKNDIRDIVWIGDRVEKGWGRESKDYVALSTKLSYINCMQ